MWLANHLRAVLEKGISHGPFLGILFALIAAVYFWNRSAGRWTSYARVFFKELREGSAFCFRIDLPLTLIIIAHLALFLPVIGRNTENPRALAAFSNDEPFLTLALDGTTSWPYGNPANFLDPTAPAYAKIPARWEDRRYPNITYYGGATYQIAFPVYAILRAIGFPAFPTAPILLRLISQLAGLAGLMILYNLSRSRGMRLAGALACIFLITDDYFNYYTTNIHPDALQFFFALLAFSFATRSANSARWVSLAAFGLMTGLVQGTKVGLPWMIPIATAVICFYFADNWKKSRDKRDTYVGIARQLAEPVFIFGATALTGYIISTPYAFIDGYYFQSLIYTLRMVNQDHLHMKVTLLAWADTVWKYFGWFGAALVVLALSHMALNLSHNKRDRVLLLAVLLAVSQFVWFATMDALWVIVGYLLVATGLMAVFGFEALLLAIGGLGQIAGKAFRLGPKVSSTIISASMVLLSIFVLDSRWYPPVSYALTLRLNSANTVWAVNRWADQSGVPKHAAILYDDLAYFDPDRFPNAQMYGGVLTWPTVLLKRPDILVLSSSLYGAPWYRNMITTQHFDWQSKDPYSMRLYQDILPARQFHASGLPDVRLMKTITPSKAAPAPSTIRDGWIDGLWARDRGRLAQLDWYHELFAAKRAGTLGVLGPELKIYALDWHKPH